MMNKRIFLILTLAIVYFSLRISYLTSPVTSEEIYLSFLGQNIIYARMVSILLGFMATLAFIKFLSYKMSEKLFLPITAVLFIISPWMIQINLFSIKGTLIILLFLTILIFINKFESSASKRRFQASLIKRFTKFTFFLPLIIIIILNISNIKGLLDQSILHDLYPENFLWQIDRRLAFAKVEGYSENIGNFDISRLVHNKPAYITNIFFQNIIIPFNFEEIASSLQAHSPSALLINNDAKLPKIFFFDIPIIILGLILFKSRNYIFLQALGCLSWALIFYKSSLGFSLLVPYIIFFQGIGLLFLLKRLPKILVFVFLIFIIAGQTSLFDLLKYHPEVWMGSYDFAQWQIWKNWNEDLDRYNKITITDRLGDPEKYSSFYVDNFPKEKLVVRSFKYLETDRREGHFWIGLPGEFVGASGDFTKKSEINDGEIIRKITNIKQSDKSLGDEIWFVETKLNR